MATEVPFIESLRQSLAASLNPQAEVRQQAEQFLTDSQQRDDFCSSLLEVSADREIDQNLSLAAAVQLGLFVEVHWKYAS